MACYSWQGINLQGDIIKGVTVAPDVGELDKLLFGREIALLHSKKISIRAMRSLKIDDIGQWAGQMAQLVKAGLRVDQSIAILAMQVTDKKKLWFLDSLLTQVLQGSSLHEALAKHSRLIDPMMISFITIGHESGDMASGLTYMADFIDQKSQTTRWIKSAIMTPMITFLFFITACIGIFVFLVPMFGALFVSLNQPMPTTTAVLVWMSDYLRSGAWMIPLIVSASVVFLLYFWAKKSYAAQLDKKILYIPVIGSILAQQKIVHIWFSIGLLLDKGLTQLQALQLCTRVEKNQFIAAQLDYISRLVEQGTRLSVAIQSVPFFNNPTVRGLIKVGEESGQLGQMILKGADIHRQKGTAVLTRITRLLGPILMLLMGILVTFLTVSVYVPLLNVAQAL